ncbi:hypothetical protein BU17DRAFT_63849 [Hysterangium stoloniferum]|nr:hypothetical protein BU17DRAFT_63849 [Hysterangium stoloniferum]
MSVRHCQGENGCNSVKTPGKIWGADLINHEEDLSEGPVLVGPCPTAFTNLQIIGIEERFILAIYIRYTSPNIGYQATLFEGYAQRLLLNYVVPCLLLSSPPLTHLHRSNSSSIKRIFSDIPDYVSWCAWSRLEVNLRTSGVVAFEASCSAHLKLKLYYCIPTPPFSALQHTSNYATPLELLVHLRKASNVSGYLAVYPNQVQVYYRNLCDGCTRGHAGKDEAKKTDSAVTRYAALPETHPLYGPVKKAARDGKRNRRPLHEMLDTFKVDLNATETIGFGRFPPGWTRPFRTLIAESKEATIEEEKRNLTELQVHSDRSDIDGGRAAGVLYRDGPSERSLECYLGLSTEHTVDKAELAGIVQDMGLLRTERKVGESHTRAGQPSCHASHEPQRPRRPNVDLQLRWIPGHVGITGNGLPASWQQGIVSQISRLANLSGARQSLCMHYSELGSGFGWASMVYGGGFGVMFGKGI